MESVGERLKKLRLEKGLTLEEVHKKTKIHLNILKAIEEDSFINLSPVYVKGFLKIYCKFLGQNSKDFIPDYKEPQSTFVYTSHIQKKPASILKTVSLKLISFKIAHIKIASIIFLIIVFLSIGLFYLGRMIFLKRDFLFRRTKSSDTTLPKLPQPASIRLVIRAKENSWVQLRSDGKVVFQGILKKDKAEAWEAKERIELSLGNAGGIDLEVNGKLLTNLGRKGQVLKNILVTKEGLSIKR